MSVQWLVVAIVVLMALVRVVWFYLPARWHQRLAARLGLRAKTATGGGCHGCDGCERSSACEPQRRTDADTD